MIARNQDINSLHLKKIKPLLKFYGETRLRTGIDIVVNGNQNVLAKINNRNEELNGKYKNVNGTVLRKIKSEDKNKAVLSKDLLYDTLATKNMVHGFNLSEKKNSKLNDYIQNICADPYGFVIMSNLNVSNFNYFLYFLLFLFYLKKRLNYGKIIQLVTKIF